MFLVRLAFWLTLVIAFIPVNQDDLSSEQRVVSTQETLMAARVAFSDLTGFCERNPDACDTGRELFSQLGVKARNGARFVQQAIDQRLAAGETETQQADPMKTGSILR